MSLCKFLSSVVLALLIGAAGAHASPLTTLYSFCSTAQGTECLDGKAPASRLVEINGALYGTASAGGSTQGGTLFRISAAGSFTLLHTFCPKTPCQDGAKPGHYLTRGPSGAVYGVTADGGVNDGGTVFRITGNGTFSVVYKFCSKPRCADGSQPVSILNDGKGSFIGTTAAGGSHGGGTVFTIGSGGVLRVLHNFCAKSGCVDGAAPGPLMRARDGNFYGMTAAGGTHHAGMIFRMTPAGAVTELYAFCGAKKCPDGSQPAGPLVEGRGGNFYGATTQQGANNHGTVFEVSPAGVLHTVYSFCASPNCQDGAIPVDGMVLAKDGSLYGTASSGGRFYNGLVFRLQGGKYSIVYNFCAQHGCFDGAAPATSPVFGSDGLLYGVTETGGASGNYGTVYRVEP